MVLHPEVGARSILRKLLACMDLQKSQRMYDHIPMAPAEADPFLAALVPHRVPILMGPKTCLVRRKQIGGRVYGDAWPGNYTMELCDERLAKAI
jgi:hypothetical protein